MARIEAYLPILPVTEDPGAEEEASLLGSFLGGDLLRTETLEQTLRGTEEIGACRNAIGQIFDVAAPWYAASAVRPLRDWPGYSGETIACCSSGSSTSPRESDRERYGTGLSWDIPFVKKEYLRSHLLGSDQQGLIHRLGTINVRYSLTHGDLQPRNVLAGRDNVWLIDFEKTGVAPTLADFAWLEVNLRLLCLDLHGRTDSLQDAALPSRLCSSIDSSAGREPCSRCGNWLTG